jgi:hypothetical protein
MTKKATASTVNYTQGTTDMVEWGAYYYATTNNTGGDITRYDGATNIVEKYYTATLGGTKMSSTTPWYPMLVYEGNLYVGNGNELIRIKPDLTVTEAILTLSSVTENISALGIDQGTGKMLIATNATNASGTLYKNTRIFLYDGFSNKALKVVPVEGLITSFKNVGNTTYVFYGNKLGYWTGSGVEYLRTLNFAKGASATQINPQRTCAIDNTLYYVDNLPGNTGYNCQIMAYGETINGIKSFYPVLYSSVPTNSITTLAPVRSHELGYSFATSKFYTFDIDSQASVINGGAEMYTKQYKFPRNVTFNGVIIEFDRQVPTGDTDLLTISCIDSRGRTTAALPVVNPGARDDGNTPPDGVYEWESTYPTIQTRSIQLKIVWGNNSTKVFGIKRITVFYTPKE